MQCWSCPGHCLLEHPLASCNTALQGHCQTRQGVGVCTIKGVVLSHQEGTVNAEWNEDIALWQLLCQRVACVSIQIWTAERKGTESEAKWRE